MIDLDIRQSELSGWADCRRKTALQYWEGWARKKNGILLPPSKANIGTIVHSGLQFKYEGQGHAGEYVRAKALEIKSQWEAEGTEMTPAWKEAYNLAAIMCSGYEEWVAEEGCDAGMTVTGVEREIKVLWGEIDGYRIWIVGHIDLECIDALGRPVLLDHKSVQSIKGTEGPVDFQRATYAVLRMLEDGTHYAVLYHNQLRRVKRTAKAVPPFYARTDVSFSIDTLRKHWAVMDAIIREMVAYRKMLSEGAIEVDSPLLYVTGNKKDCSWKCPYYRMCPMMDDGSDWKFYLGENYEQTGTVVPGHEIEEDE